MDAMEKRLSTSAAGEHRLDPDQQREYFNTFKERVVLTVSVPNAKTAAVKDHIDQVLAEFAEKYDFLVLKISPILSDNLQMTYMKAAKSQGIKTCIVDEDKAHSAFGLILHTNHAAGVTETAFSQLYPQYFAEKAQVDKQEKKSFWTTLFG